MSRAVITKPAPIQNQFSGVLKSEFIKLMSLRSIRITLLLTVLIGVGIASLGSYVMSSNIEEYGGIDDPQAQLIYLIEVMQTPVMFQGLLFGVLGVFSMSSEYSSGMILSTFTATPQRARVFGAKLITVSLIALAAAVVTLAAALFVALMFFPGAREVIGETQFFTSVLGAIIFLFTMTVLAYGIAGLLRSTAGGIAVVAGLTFVLPIAFSFATMADKEWIDWIMGHLPLMLAQILGAGVVETAADVGGEPVIDAVMSWGEAALSMGGWALILVVPAFFLFMKRDAK